MITQTGQMTWMPMSLSPPPLAEPVEWCRMVYELGNNAWMDKPFVAAWCEFPPEFNVYGLHWRPLAVRLREAGL